MLELLNRRRKVPMMRKARAEVTDHTSVHNSALDRNIAITQSSVHFNMTLRASITKRAWYTIIHQ
jgi:hypothetical protein